MPAMLERVIEDLRLKDGVTVSCIVADFVMAWALEIARKIGIRGVLFNPASAAINSNKKFTIFVVVIFQPISVILSCFETAGLATTQKRFQLSPRIPPMDTEFIWWAKISDSKTEKMLFNIILQSMKTLESTEWCFCNSTPDLEPGALSFVPKLLPIGSLLRTYDDDQGVTERSLGQFWEEDFSCLNWLDQQPHGSVIYVAFGSTTLFDEKQFKELALGLELTNRPFLWVVRKDSDCSNKVCFPNEFKGNEGKIIEWAPQEKVLRHPAIACFISHCGWNSTLEGLSNGVPFLCWPYFADQFFDKIYICDEWKVGLGFDLDENGMISREEIKVKVDKLLSDENIRFKARELKKKLMKDVDVGGRSSENLNKFINWLKE
ncbi:UDP-glycosyltransferase 83A1-like [Arachis hypogaea]|uniref:UDP-glycosyltransferase 83A1-like n=1 Tax=Arachis hypogaea TaxID=3818 RepID=UPI003B216452